MNNTSRTWLFRGAGFGKLFISSSSVSGLNYCSVKGVKGVRVLSADTNVNRCLFLRVPTQVTDLLRTTIVSGLDQIPK